MSEVKNIHQRLLEVMKEVDYIQKENKKVNDQYTFVSHDAVTAKVRPFFVKNGILVVPTIKSHDKEKVITGYDKFNKVDKVGLLSVIVMQIDFINIDDPKDRITVEYIGYGIDGGDKGVGKAVSYAVKYAYLKVLGLETGDDPERDNIECQASCLPKEKPSTAPIQKLPEKPESNEEKQTLLDAIEKATSMSEVQEKYDKAKLWATQKNDKVFFAKIKEITAKAKSKLEGEPNEPFSK